MSIVVDLSRFLVGPVFEAIGRDPVLFAKVEVDPEFGSVFWPNGADIAPETLATLRETAVSSQRFLNFKSN